MNMKTILAAALTAGFFVQPCMTALEAGDATPGQWKEENGVWYFENNGGRYTGWIRPDGNWYYMDPAAGGAMVSNTSMVIDGVTYSFNGSGVMQ